MSRNFLFSSYDNTKLQMNDKNISSRKYTRFDILNPVMKEIKSNSVFGCFSLYHAVQKGNQSSG